MNKTKAKDTSWPPEGVRDLSADIPIRDRPDHVRFPTLRGALERGTAVTPATLTDQLVRDVLRGNRRYRDVEYLCRAYLQFGSAAMSTDDLQRLCTAINRLGKG